MTPESFASRSSARLTLGTIGVVLPFPAGPAEFLSPSLARSAGSAPSYELKFLLPQARAERIEDWARRHLAPDPHADPTLGGAYRVHTLYLDTPQLDVYRRSKSYRRRKFRLRRYDAEPAVFLERKTKSGDRVAKRRSQVTGMELARLTDGDTDPDWAGHWFRRRLLARQLRPTCRISYERAAYVGAGADGPLRLTMDRRILCLPAEEWTVGPTLPEETHSGLPILTRQVILELKYSTALPALFKRLIEEMTLAPNQVSKYRLGVETWGLGTGTKEVG